MGTEKNRCRHWTKVADCKMLLVVAQSLLLAAFVGDSEVLSYTQSHGKPHMDVPTAQPHALDLGTRAAAESWAMSTLR